MHNPLALDGDVVNALGRASAVLAHLQQCRNHLEVDSDERYGEWLILQSVRECLAYVEQTISEHNAVVVHLKRRDP